MDLLALVIRKFSLRQRFHVSPLLLYALVLQTIDQLLVVKVVVI